MNHFKKTVVFLLILTVALAFAACGSTTAEPVDTTAAAESAAPAESTDTAAPAAPTEPETTDCVHEFGQWETVISATCKDRGEQIRACRLCSYEEREAIEKSSTHTEVTDAALAATCTADGLTEGAHCSTCNTVLKAQSVIKATGHTEVSDAPVAATCTADGLTGGTHCSACNAVLKAANVIKATGHTEVTDAPIAATCTVDGLTEGAHCSTCNAVLKAASVIKAAGHIEVTDAGAAATCTADGLTDGIHCSTCNAVLRAQSVIKATGHTEVIDAAVYATGIETGLTEGKHCSVCHAVLAAQEVIPVVAPVKMDFPGGSITKAPTTIRTKHLQIEIPAGVYVPDELVEHMDIITPIIEEVSGLKFAGNPHYAEGLLRVTVDDNQHAHASASSGAVVNTHDLLDYYAIIHESTHVLQFRQSNWGYCIWAMEGITTYTKYKLRERIQQEYPELTEYVAPTNQSMLDHTITDYGKLYEHTMEYWMDNPFEYAYNDNYSIGFRFMRYLDVTYGNYTKWILLAEEMHPFHLSDTHSAMLTTEQQVTIFKTAYGETVFEDFYKWLKKNESYFTYNKVIDLRRVEFYNLHPILVESDSALIMTRCSDFGDILYKDLYLNLASGMKYLTEACGKTVESATLNLYADGPVRLFDSEGRLLRTEPAYQTIDLAGVSFLQLVGEGSLSRVEITLQFSNP